MATERKMILKACPFCGKVAYLCSRGSLWRVVCSVGCAQSPEEPSCQSAVSWWNRRPSRPRGKAQKGKR